jgi:phosphoesterase RecJ-like protein
MPGAREMVNDDDIRPRYGAAVVLDGDRRRLHPATSKAFEAASVRAIVDHHVSTRAHGYTHAWLEPSRPSTCEMIYTALEDWSIPLDTEMAELIYAGAVYDTGGFRYSNSTPHTLHMAAELMAAGIDHGKICTRLLMERRRPGLRLAGEVYQQASFCLNGALVVGKVTLQSQERHGAVRSDTEGLVDALVHTEGVQVAVLLIENDDETVKFSLRSRCNVNLAEIARALSPLGGGHLRASGATKTCTLDEAEQEVVDLLSKQLEVTAQSSQHTTGHAQDSAIQGSPQARH